MHRLAEGRPVVLDLEEEAIDCVVAALDDGHATIAPVIAADAAYIPSLGRAAALVYDDDGNGGARVRIPGVVRRAQEAGRLRFEAGDASTPPARRRAPRTDAELPVELTANGAPRRLLTTDVSLGGLGVRADDALVEGALVRFALELPAAPPIGGTARVIRVADTVAGLAFEEIAPADRARLAAFLIAGHAR
jgi:PilZ domain-containing protein